MKKRKRHSKLNDLVVTYTQLESAAMHALNERWVDLVNTIVPTTLSNGEEMATLGGMVCEICKQGPSDGVSVFRTGKKGPGENPHWRCQADAKADQIPEEDLILAAVIESGNATKQ